MKYDERGSFICLSAERLWSELLLEVNKPTTSCNTTCSIPPASPRPTVSEANIEPLLLHAEVRGKGQLHHVPCRVQRQTASRQTAELDVRASRVYHDPVVHAGRRLFQVEVEEGELDDEARGRLHGPLTGLRVRVFLGVTG